MFKSKSCLLSCSLDLKKSIDSMEDFRNISQETFDKIISITHIREYPRDTILYYENDPMDSIHFLLHGCVKIYKINKFDNEVIINIYANSCINQGNPPLINYQALISKYSYNNIFCLENCRILSINSESFKEMIKEDINLSLNMLDRANKLIEDQENIININMIYDAKAKLASILSKRPNIFNDLNKKFISQMLNISQETLSRNIQKLKDENIIGLDINKHLVVINENKLNSILKAE